MQTKSDKANQNKETIAQLREQLLSDDVKIRIEAAFALAKAGIFEGVNVLMEGLRHKYEQRRSDAAHYLGRIGVPQVIPLLAEVAKADPESQTRNVAIYALEGIGQKDCIPHLIDCLKDDDPARRVDARTALVRIIGESVALVTAKDEMEVDSEEFSRVRTWFQSVTDQFGPDKVYYKGIIASPGIFIAELRENLKRPTDAVLMKLEDWTGQSFRARSMRKVVERWEVWWQDHKDQYEPGERYFYGHKVR